MKQWSKVTYARKCYIYLSPILRDVIPWLSAEVVRKGLTTNFFVGLNLLPGIVFFCWSDECELRAFRTNAIVCNTPKISLRDGIFPKRRANLTISVIQCRSTNLLSTLLTNVSAGDKPISCSRYRGSNSGSTPGSDETECWRRRSKPINMNGKKTHNESSWEWMIQTNGDREVPLIKGRWI